MPNRAMNTPLKPNACLLLADGTVFSGYGIGATQSTIGEICFNTGMTGYQEVLTDPSYAGQIITFTFPHIGNVGCNAEDIEATAPRCAGLVIREPITEPSSFRSEGHLDAWLKKNNVSGISGIDTRALTRHIREKGAQNAMIISLTAYEADKAAALNSLQNHPSMKGLDLAKTVTTNAPYKWNQGTWDARQRSGGEAVAEYNVVAIDYGEKLNILRCLVDAGCRVTVVPATMPAAEILALNPDGIFLSNGPGDPAATGTYAIATLRALMDANIPMFGICLGHQLLGLAIGAKTEKMPQGHRGANHPVKNLVNGTVEITSQNHGFCVVKESLPANTEATHISLFDGTLEGFRVKDKPVFAVQYHPESSPGPHDSHYLFDQFVAMMHKRVA